MIEAEQLHARILARLDMTRDMEDEELTELIYEVLQEVSQEEYLPLDQKTMLGKELFNAFRKLDLLQEFLEDDDITEIMINGTQNIFIEKAGRISQSDKRFLSADKLEDVIQQIVAGSNRLVNEASPIADARLADGSRDFSCSFYICISCFQSYQILYILNLKFCVVFDRYDAFIFGYILR